MSYEIVFPSERVERNFEKALEKLPADYQAAVAEKVRSLSLNPRPEGKRYKKLKGEVVVAQFIAQYRIRIGPYRLLYDIDETRKKVILLKLVKRDEHTYV
ncbi:MAG: type II toxin-antitoxin system RelE/ParE family toxin [Nitrospira sp.]|nr:type II toxin-antitoxin system RelE/ParE family toxin [Nitrospira sp.]